MRVLLTNDDGIHADGLQALRSALLELPGIELAVVAPDGNRSAMARSITTRRPLWVEQVDFADGTHGYATDGTPVDCVRLTALGLIDGFVPELIVSGINHGANLGDDITYSGTVAASLEGIVLGLPGFAVSQVGRRDHSGDPSLLQFDFTRAAAFAARMVAEAEAVPLPAQTIVNVNVPAGEPRGVRVATLGKRTYRDELVLLEEGADRRRRYRVYGDVDFDHTPGEGTDLAAIAEGCIAVTPLHLDLVDRPGVETLRRYDLERLLEPATEELPGQP